MMMLIRRTAIAIAILLCLVEGIGSRHLREHSSDEEGDASGRHPHTTQDGDDDHEDHFVLKGRELRKKIWRIGGGRRNGGTRKKKKKKQKNRNDIRPKRPKQRRPPRRHNKRGKKPSRSDAVPDKDDSVHTVAVEPEQRSPTTERESCSLALNDCDADGHTCYHPLGELAGTGVCLVVRERAREFEPCDASQYGEDAACRGSRFTCLRANGLPLGGGMGTGVCGRRDRSADQHRLVWRDAALSIRPRNVTATTTGIMWYADYYKGEQGECVMNCEGEEPCGGASLDWDNLFVEWGDCCKEKLWWMSKKRCVPTRGTYPPTPAPKEVEEVAPVTRPPIPAGWPTFTPPPIWSPDASGGEPVWTPPEADDAVYVPLVYTPPPLWTPPPNTPLPVWTPPPVSEEPSPAPVTPVPTEEATTAVPTVGVTTAVPTVGVTTAVPTVGVTTAVPTVGVTTAVPTVGVTTAVPTIGATTMVPTVGVTTAVPTVGVTTMVPTIGATTMAPTIGVTTSAPTIGATTAETAVGATPTL